VAALGVAVALEERGEVERLLDDLGDEAGEVLLGELVVEVRRKQEELVRIVGREDQSMLLGRSHASGQRVPGFMYDGPPGGSYQFSRGARP